MRKTWKLAQGGKKTCIWCYRDASVCTIEDPCNGRKRWEEERALLDAANEALRLT